MPVWTDMRLSRLAIAALTLAFGAPAGFAQTTTTTTPSRSFSFSPAGLASSETAQVNVANLANASSNGTAASCNGSISFLNASGAVIGTATSFTATSGQIFSATLPFSRSGGTSVRTEIRGLVTLTSSSTANAPCSLASSFETFDTTTGATHIYLDNGLESAPSIHGGH
jgi:hypothetical protein